MWTKILAIVQTQTQLIFDQMYFLDAPEDNVDLRLFASGVAFTGLMAPTVAFTQVSSVTPIARSTSP